jgi:RNA polymerase sigma factor for flagellar operon FliA
MSSEQNRTQVERLVEEYLPYAEALARSMRASLPSHVDPDELLSLARLGLVDAAQRFDPDRKVSFKTYAYYRIRGSIFDGLRAMVPASRTDAARFKFRSAMELYLRQESETIGAAKGKPRAVDVEDMKNLVFVMASVYVLSLDSTLEHTELEARGTRNPQDEMERHELAELLQQLIRRLGEQEQQIIRMYYFENRTLDEIGATLNLSKSWICRMHARAMKKLQKMFQGAGKPGKSAIRA